MDIILQEYFDQLPSDTEWKGDDESIVFMLRDVEDNENKKHDDFVLSQRIVKRRSHEGHHKLMVDYVNPDTKPNYFKL
jgi:hypothetical protein